MLSAADPWSVSLNPDIYDWEKTDEIYVTISRESDNKTWTLNANNQDEQGDFFRVDHRGYGVNFAVVFRPNQIERYIHDDVYHITIHNLHTLAREKTSISYTTKMFEMQASFKNSATRSALAGQQFKLPVSGNATRFTSSNSSIVSVDSNGVITAHKEGHAYI